VTQHIPIIIVTTKDQETDRVWAKRQGASDYLVKPVKEEELLALIDSLLKARVS
jgi:twitching motility two-component system response regulator PilH